MSLDGLLKVDEGSIYWILDSPDTSEPQRNHRPILLFIHAGVADHSLWDDQVRHFTSRGWAVLRYDILGYGKSLPNDAFLGQSPRPAVSHYQHTAQVVRNVHYLLQTPCPQLEMIEECDKKVVVVGLSRGGAIAVDFVIANPGLAAGLVVVAGGLSGFCFVNTPEEDVIFSQEDKLLEAHDADSLAQWRARIWGDGPLQPEGRTGNNIKQMLYRWCKDLAIRELNDTGGFAITEQYIEPPAEGRLSEIEVPVAVAVGVLDESSTISAMRFISEHVKNVTMKDFNSAHMVNLELPGEFNLWLEGWLGQFARQ